VDPDNIQFRMGDRGVQVTYPALVAGSYQLTLDTASITDRAGNPLGNSPLVTHFTKVDQVLPVRWINPNGGFWDDPNNWDTGAVPGPADDVAIDMPGNVSITYRSGNTTVRSL